MKTTILLAIALTIMTSFSFGQTMDEPFKKANTILIETNQSSNDIFIKWGKHLVQNSYTIDKSDNNFLTLTTGPQNTSRFNYDFIVLSSVNDAGTINIKIKWRLKASVIANTDETGFSARTLRKEISHV